jgi:hypothetical protein
MDRTRRAANLIALTTAGLGLSLGAVAQTVYKTVDEEGNVAFTDRPPMSQSDSTLETVRGLDITRTDPVVVAARNQRADAEQRAGDIARGLRKEEAAEEQAAQKENAAERSANCDAAEARLKRYSESRRLYRQTPDGEREYLSSSEIDSARTDAILSVDKWCG